MRVNKLSLLIISIAILIFDAVALIIWISKTPDMFNDIKIFYDYIMSNMFSLVIFADLLVFSIIAIIWMYYDSTRRKMKFQFRIIIIILAIIIGSPVLLIYLAFRKKDE